MTELRKKGSIHNYKPVHGHITTGMRPLLTCIKCNARGLNEVMKRWNAFLVCKDGCK